ncbi:MAG: DNA primase [Ignavibacteria bacterium CG_4_8_14_3_um_filter_37_9]|nr:MAG: DNA primase [Ignavibacteria bacterium CG_4_8_14_3_um_filter_37_9]
MRISEAQIEQIRISADIVDVISSHVQLRKRGKNFIGLCPFHNEKTPSFTVSQDKQIFHCFGCHSGGNVFKFLMEYKKISFVESIQEMAAELGITLEYENQKSEAEQSETEILYDINTSVAKFFSDNLLKEEDGNIARKYFEERKIKPQTLRSFGLGYCPDHWDATINFLNKNNIDIEKSLQLGVIGKSDKGKLYDKFAGRMIFPIFSPNGRVIGFGGRIFDAREGAAKYLNSPESKIYHKGRTLYGLSHGKDEIRRHDLAIVVEGYMDLISLHQHGVKNVVAVSGTAFTDEQVQLLSRYTKNTVLLFDADTAGVKASMRSIEILLKQNMNIKIATLPKGEDPDSFVQKNGSDAFLDVISRAVNFLEYQTAIFEEQGYFNDAAKSAEAIRELVKPVALLNDELKRSFLLKSIAEKFGLREKLLEAELEKAIIAANKFPVQEQIQKEKVKLKKISEADDVKMPPAEFRNEQEIIILLFEENEQITRYLLDHVNPDEFQIAYHRILAHLVYDALINDEALRISTLLEKIEDEKLQEYLLEITFEKYLISDVWDQRKPENKEKRLLKYANDLIKFFKLYHLEKEIIQNHALVEKAEDEEEALRLMKNGHMLYARKKEIEKGNY